jgi:hypothetical protein
VENVTLETDELGIWLVEELDNGLVNQMGHIPWSTIASYLARTKTPPTKTLNQE